VDCAGGFVDCGRMAGLSPRNLRHSCCEREGRKTLAAPIIPSDGEEDWPDLLAVNAGLRRLADGIVAGGQFHADLESRVLRLFHDRGRDEPAPSPERGAPCHR
jgi:hypothetical protein